MLYVLNLGEAEAGKLHEREKEFNDGPLAGRRNARPRPYAARSKPSSPNSRARIRREYLASYGLKESGLERLISATYSLLGLMSFLTAGEDECRAWTIPMNSTRGESRRRDPLRLRKEVHPRRSSQWNSLVDLGGYPGVREKGLLRLEGKEYIVKDGDVLVIRHS